MGGGVFISSEHPSVLPFSVAHFVLLYVTMIQLGMHVLFVLELSKETGEMLCQVNGLFSDCNMFC